MKQFLFTFFSLILFMSALQAQKDETLIGKTGLKLTGLWAGTNLGLLYFDDRNKVLTGGFLGLEFNKSLMLGLATVSSSASGTLNRPITIDHGGFLIGYTYKSHRVIHPRISFLMGSGKLKLKDEPDDNIFVVQPSAGFEVNVFRWFRMGFEGGYRFVSNISLPNQSDDGISAPFAQLSLRFGWSWGSI